MDTVEIIADTRELPSGVIECLQAVEGIRVEIATLRSGDYRVDGSALIERKSAADFCASLCDGRLFAQAGRLAASGLHAALILEGASAEWRALGLSRESFQGALVSLAVVFKIPILRSAGIEETARLILYAGRQLARARTTGTVLHAGRKPKRPERRKLHLLRQLPGIGPEKADRLLAHFGSVRDCLAAGREELEAVEGIGPTIAAQILEIVG